MSYYNRTEAAGAGATIYQGRACRVCTDKNRYVSDSQCVTCAKARARVRRLRIRELQQAAKRGNEVTQ